jgi:hypothetical protein
MKSENRNLADQWTLYSRSPGQSNWFAEPHQGDLPSFAVQWTHYGLTPSHFAKHAKWLAEPRQLGSNSTQFFQLAGKLLLLAQNDYELISPAFFHTVIGLERALKVHYKDKGDIYGCLCEGSADSFSELFQRGVDDGVIHDGLFPEIKPPPDWALELVKDLPETRTGILAVVVPKLRNLYFHGAPLLDGEFYFIGLQLRRIADALKTRGTVSLLE